MKKIKFTIAFIITIIFGVSCSDYLNIVPDNLATIDHAFSMRAQAEKYLFTCYSYLPIHGKVGSNPALVGGDEITTTTSFRSGGGIHSWYISHGEQSAARVRCDFWRGADGATDMYQGISDCNIFLENIHKVPDMTQTEKNRWIAEVKFLKAYYHYWMIRMYGPIPIKDTNVPVNADSEKVRPHRNTLDECFEYVITLMDEIIESKALPLSIENQAQELGRISHGIVMAIKAEVLVTAASPLFNGNLDYKGYTDNRGIEIFNPEKTEDQKMQRWVDAEKACEEAIAFLKEQGHDLFYFTDTNLKVSDDTRLKMNIRGAFTENWNKEIIWGNPNLISKSVDIAQIQSQAIPRGLKVGSEVNATAGGNLGVPLKIANQFYSKNGVPIEEDREWDYENRFDLKKATATDKFFIKEGYTTAKLNFDREIRYYASLGFDGAIWFGQGVLDEDKSLYVQSKQGQSAANQIDHTWNQTGIFPKKLAHYKSVVGDKSGMTCENYAFPVMTMNNLYLLYAEALNERGATQDDVLEWVNLIRKRANLETVQYSWTNFSSNSNKFESKDGRREIIQRERNIELAFGGQRFWDLRRWKLAYSELNKPITGWDTSAAKAEEYYVETLVFEQKFNVRDYFWPIANDEVYANKNTKQNFGW